MIETYSSVNEHRISNSSLIIITITTIIHVSPLISLVIYMQQTRTTAPWFISVTFFFLLSNFNHELVHTYTWHTHKHTVQIRTYVVLCVFYFEKKRVFLFLPLFVWFCVHCCMIVHITNTIVCIDVWMDATDSVQHVLYVHTYNMYYVCSMYTNI